MMIMEIHIPIMMGLEMERAVLRIQMEQPRLSTQQEERNEILTKVCKQVCKREEIEPMQNWMNVTGFLFRCIGAVLADYLGANASTGLFLGLLLSLVLGNTALHTQLLPVSSG